MMELTKILENPLYSLFCRIFEALPDLTIVVNESGGILFASTQALPLIGYAPGELIGLNIELLIPERYREVHSNHCRNYFASPRVRPMGGELNLYIQHKDGSELPIEIGLSPITTEQGRLVICAVRDASNRKKIETAFLGDERFRLFMRHAPSAIAMFDCQMRYLAVSSHWLEEYQLLNKDIIGLSHYDVFPEITDQSKEIHRRCLAGEALQAEATLFIRADGKQEWVNWRMHPWHLDTGEIGGAILFTEVVTEQTKIELAMHKSEARFRGIFEKALTGISISDRAGHFLQCNPAYCDLLGYSEEELRHIEFSTLIHPDDQAANLALYFRLLTGELSYFEIENRYIHKGGQVVWVHKYVSTLTDETGESAQFQVLAADITDRKRNEVALRDSDALNISILNSLTSHIAVLDEQGIIVAVNNAWQEFAKENGLTENQQNMIGVNYLGVCENAMIHPYGEEASAVYTGITAVLKGEQSLFSLEYPCHSPTQQRWFYMKVSPLQGSRNGVVISHENITERKLMEDGLKVSEAKFRSIIEASPVPMVLNDERSNIIFLNPVFVETFGYTIDEIPTLTDWWLKAYPDPDYRHWVQANWQRTQVKVEQDEIDSAPLDVAIHCKDNYVKSVFVSTAKIQHNFVGEHLAILYDITEQKQNEVKLNAIFNAAVEGIISYDRSDIIVSANATVEAIFGYKLQELIGCSIHKLKLSREEFTFSKGEPGQIQEVIGRHKDGTPVPLDISRAEYSIDNKSFFTIIVRDITLRKHREELDKMHLAELAHVTRLGLMSEMAAGIAHEVNQPLSVITNYMQASINLINTENANLAALADIISKTKQQAVRAGEIIHRMRDFIKPDAKQRVATDINTLIHDSVLLCTDDIKRHNIQLAFILEEKLPLIFVDHIQIEQVIINLIRNSIEVLQGLLENQQRNLSIHSQLTANNEIQVRVKDNGPGMDFEHQEKILTPFYTTKSYGMGMGLSICRSLMESHGGNLHFNSQPGKGTSFYLTLPVKASL